jgi:hypothetical protein
MRKYPAGRGFGAAAIAAVCMMLVTATAFAAWQFLRPADVARQVDDTALAAAFDSDTAVNINQSAVSGDYIFTLLAVASGKDISSRAHYSNGNLQSDRTYAVLAVQKSDGSAMPDIASGEYGNISFFASPLVNGLKPWFVNAATLNGSFSDNVADGILYRIVECDNVAVFADRGLYFAVNTGPFFTNDAFRYDETTGVVTANPDYNGASVVFDLPMDVNLADGEKAAALIESLYPAEEDMESHSQDSAAAVSNDVFLTVNEDAAAITPE